MLDRVGSVLAGVCAVHCAALPLVLVTTSGFGLAVLSWHHPYHLPAIWLVRASAWEVWFAGATLLLAAAALAIGYRRHFRLAPAGWALTAAVLFGAAILSPLAFDPFAHAGLAVAAGACLMRAHALNARLRRASRRSL